VSEPRVTVLMPVHNGGCYLREAIESILRQSLKDFEFLIIDDGSQDESVAVVKSYRDERIRLIENGRNLGLIATLNRGLQMARGEYVARMDADDISLPRRLERQLEYMERHPDVSVISSYYRYMDSNGRPFRTVKGDVKDCHISFRMYVEGYNPVCHPAAMFRIKMIREQGGYNREFAHAEDGALWFRLNSEGMKFGNVPRVLFLYRSHSQQITQTRTAEQAESHFRAYAQSLSRYLGEPIEIEDVVRLCPYRFDEEHIGTPEELDRLLQLKRRIALKFFDAMKPDPLCVVSCVTYLWSSLLTIRTLGATPAGYTGRLFLYGMDILRQGLKGKRGAGRVPCKCLFTACLVKTVISELWSKARRGVRRLIVCRT
jgi:glycosyltransferase involved in cell wall biosynthesis